MPEIPLHHVHTYTDVDRAFWETHLEAWVPPKVFDAHVHIVDPAYQIETLTEELKRDVWVMELLEMQTAETAERCYRTVFPGREVSCLCFGFPSLGFEIEGANEYVRREAVKRGWRCLAVVRPTWVAEQVAWLLDQPGVLGVKPYYTLLGYDRATRDRYLEASIFGFLPHHQLEVLNERGAWVTLHVPRAARLGHPDNLREVREIRSRYPRVRLVIAHFGRSYCLPHAEESLPALAEDAGLLFDNSAVMNPEVHAFALELLGPKRVLYGTDNPIFYLRGRQQFQGRAYVNRTSLPFHFNKEREPPEVEARYTLYMYEALKALKDVCDRLGYGPEEARALLHDNAASLVSACEA